MDEKKSIADFNRILDLILKEKPASLNMENVETNDLLALAAKISKTDYSGESKIYEILKQKLLKLKTESDNRELSDDELDCAAGGLSDFRDKDHS